MAEPIKKTLLITLDFPPQLGGVATYYYNFCKNLPPDKIVVLAPEVFRAEEFDQRQNFPIIRKNILRASKRIFGLDKVRATLKWLSINRYLTPIIKNHKVEMIVVGQILPIGTLAWLLLKRKKIPYVFFAHGLDIMLPQNSLRKKMLVKKIIDKAHGIIANSYWTADQLINLGANKEKIIVVYPCPNLKDEQISEWKINQLKHNYDLNNHKIILTVGRLVERKGHDFVLKALPKIIKSVPNVIYLIVGSGPNQKNLELIVNQLSLRDHVRFIPAVSQDELADLYQICDVFLMPSRQLKNGDVEGFGIVFLEANLFGKPVIGGRSGGIPEAIIDGKTGLLVEPTDLNDIAEKTIRILTDEAYSERLGFQGLHRVSEEFDWPTQINKIKAILK